MLSKQFRLPLKKEFLRIKKAGRYLNGELITILYCLSPTQLNPRFSFIVSKKISNLSTKRNRVKRLLREGIRSLLPEIKKNGDFIIMAKSAILNKNLVEIKEELKIIFNNRFTA